MEVYSTLFSGLYQNQTIQNKVNSLEIECLKILEILKNPMNHCDKTLHIDGLFTMIIEKNKDVKIAANQFMIDSAKFLNEEFIENKIKEQRPYIQETLRQTIRKLIYSKSRTSEQLNNNLAKKIKVEGNDETQKSHTDLSVQETHKPRMEVIIVNESNLNLKLSLKSVQYFSEPTDSDIRNLNVAFNSFLAQTIVSGLFSFQAETVNTNIERLKHMSCWNKANSLIFFQYIYIRLYDTTRETIFESMEKLFTLMVFELNKAKITFPGNTETELVFHSLLRYFYACQSPNIAMILQAISFLNLNHMCHLFSGIISKPEFNLKFFDFLDEILSQFANRIPIQKEFVNLLFAITKKHPWKVKRILSILLESKNHISEEMRVEINSIYIQISNENSFRKTVTLKNETLVLEFCSVLKRLSDKLHFEETKNVELLLDFYQTIAREKNILCKINIDTRSRFFALMFEFLAKLRLHESNPNCKFEKSEIISSEELILIFRGNLRLVYKNNLESVCLAHILEEMDKHVNVKIEEEGSFFGLLSNEISKNFKQMIVRIIDNLDNCDFGDLLSVAEYFLRKYKNNKSNLIIVSIDLLIKGLIKSKKDKFEELLNIYPCPLFQEYLTKNAILFEQDKIDIGMVIEEQNSNN